MLRLTVIYYPSIHSIVVVNYWLLLVHSILKVNYGLLIDWIYYVFLFKPTASQRLFCSKLLQVGSGKSE